MALKPAVRWRPDAYRSSLETTIQNFDPTATPPTGTIIRLAQLVVYDDTKLTVYKPGDPATESLIYLLFEEPIGLELASFGPLNAAQSTASWQNALSAWGTKVQPAVQTLAKAQYGALSSAPIIGATIVLT